MAPSPTKQLATYERRYRELAEQVAEIGFISSGTVTRRYTTCSSAGCRCHADPPQRHGPYYQWTTKTDGKTRTRRLTRNQAKLYTEWIGNDRRLQKIIQQMRQIASKAAELKLAQATNSGAPKV
jgi:hypothetical protein